MGILKNWTITAKGMKNGQNGLFNYVNYLNDTNRHKGQKLTDISHDKALKNMLQSHNDFELEKQLEQKRHKGGRPSNVGWSAQLSYPFDITNEQFFQLKNRITYDFYNYVNNIEKLGMTDNDIRELMDSTIGVIHSGETVNNHIHMIFNKVMPKKVKHLLKTTKIKKTSIDLTKKKYLYNLKLINDKAIEEILNINKADYVIKQNENETVKPQKKRKTKIQIQNERYEQRMKHLDDRESDLKLREDKIVQLRQRYEIMAVKAEKQVEMYDKKISVIDKTVEQLKEYTKGQFKKDMELHSLYMSKGMTEKATKLENKIDNKLNKVAEKTKSPPKM